jgi:flagellar motor switch protein FliM
METLPQSPSTQAQVAVIASGASVTENVQACDFRAVGGIDKARLAPLVTATEAFTRAFGPALQQRLGMTCEATLQSSEQMACHAFLEKAGNSYFVSLQLGSHGEMVLLQIDSMLLFPVVDRLLGGGGPSDLSREVTEIEDQIAKDFVKLIGQELEAAWQRFDVSLSVGMRQLSDQLQRIWSTKDNALVFSFSVNMQSSGGGFQLMLPIASLGRFLGVNTTPARELSRKGVMSSKLAEKSLDWTFGLELALSGGKVPATELLNLSAGKIVQLGVPVRSPVVLKIGGYDSFEAVPVRIGNHRGAQLLERLPPTQIETESTT